MCDNSNILWLIPPSTKKSQCLEIILTTKSHETIDIIASEYQCLYGHHSSKLLLELYEQSQSPPIHLEEEDHLDIIQALRYIHSNSPESILQESSPLILGRTASYMKMEQLCHHIALEAARTLSYIVDMALEPSVIQMSVWDAIALLHLLGDRDNILSQVHLSYWCESRPDLFADESLFSSCRNIFTPKQLASIIQGINIHHAHKIDQLIESHDSFIYEKQLLIQSLTDDIEVLLEQYIGKKIALKDEYNPARINIRMNRRHNYPNISEKMTGTIIKIDPVRRNELVVMWHHDASSTNVKVSSLHDYEIEK